jgi:enoyl-CoA hydratase/carnithine racemase
MSSIDLDYDGRVALITMNDPPANLLTVDLVDQFSGLVDAVARGAARALIVRGNGADFSRGADLAGWLDGGLSAVRYHLVVLNQLYQQIESLSVPTIAAVTGACFAGGFDLALHCDLIVAAHDARFRFPEVTFGLPPLLGGLQRVAERAGRAQAARLALLSDTVSGSEAASMGLLARVTDSADVMPVALDLARRLASGATLAYTATKDLLTGWSQGGLGTADRLLLDIGRAALGSDDFQRGVSTAVQALRAGTERPALDFGGR